MKCPKCASENTTIDYGSIDDDSRIFDKVIKGETPYCCLDCGAGWCTP